MCQKSISVNTSLTGSYLVKCSRWQNLPQNVLPLQKYTSHLISFNIAIIPNIGSIIFYNWYQWYLLFLWWVALLLDWPRYCRYQLWNTLFVPHLKEGNVVYCHFIFRVNIWCRVSFSKGPTQKSSKYGIGPSQQDKIVVKRDQIHT